MLVREEKWMSERGKVKMKKTKWGQNHPETASAVLKALDDRVLGDNTFSKPGATDLLIITDISPVIESHSG